FHLDALRDQLPNDYDVITCSLFLHHLTDEQAIDLLRRMACSARKLVLINDLVRSPWGYLLAILATRTLTLSPVVHSDGPQSVASAFTVSEALDMAKRAGWNEIQIRRHWPFRFLLQWKAVNRH